VISGCMRDDGSGIGVSGGQMWWGRDVYSDGSNASTQSSLLPRDV